VFHEVDEVVRRGAPSLMQDERLERLLAGLRRREAPPAGVSALREIFRGAQLGFGLAEPIQLPIHFRMIRFCGGADKSPRSACRSAGVAVSERGDLRNSGILPSGYSAIVEQRAGEAGPDMHALEAAGRARASSGESPPPEAGLAVALEPPQTRFRSHADVDFRVRLPTHGSLH